MLRTSPRYRFEEGIGHYCLRSLALESVHVIDNLAGWSDREQTRIDVGLSFSLFRYPLVAIAIQVSSYGVSCATLGKESRRRNDCLEGLSSDLIYCQQYCGRHSWPAPGEMCHPEQCFSTVAPCLMKVVKMTNQRL